MRPLALLLTTLTGFSGLVYEVTWQKYLAALLGSHSEATAAVLAIFLGGLAIGYALFGVLTRRLVERAAWTGESPRLLFVYGFLEVGIGLYAFGFPWLFQRVSAISYALPHALDGFGFAFDVVLAAVLIGPPTVVMGATIPILTQALARDLEDATRFHAFVYGFNTLGAFFGALSAAFFLIPSLGLAGVMSAMGAVNLVAGGIFIVWGRSLGVGAVRQAGASVLPRVTFTAYALVALLTGFAMMTVQTIVIRIGALAFGSSEYTFAMVVAVFVLCIALGSFAVSLVKRVPHGVLPGVLFGLVVLLCVLDTLLPQAPYWVHVIRTGFGSGAADFYRYYLAGFGAVLVGVAPAVLLSGAVLPLVFDHLRQQVGDLGALAGKLYSWNTVGSLLGALFGGYLLFFWFDLDQIFRIAVAAVAVSALLLCGVLYGVRRAAAVTVVVAIAVLPLVSARWDPRLLTGGLFRLREPVFFTGQGVNAVLLQGWQEAGYELLFHEDDPIMTVTVVQEESGGRRARSIVNNGKSDGNTVEDLSTMVMLAALPALYADRLERAFVIGYGTGITAGELASFPSVEKVSVAEISPAVMQAAPLFDNVNHHASRHPKVEIVRSDAYRALMRSEARFDVIISEPSNPWVTGVEMLFSREFLKAASERLEEGGIFAQWIQEYEIDDASIELILRTFLSVFKNASVWRTADDLIVLGSAGAFHERPLVRIEQRLQQQALTRSLLRAGIDSLPALLSHEIVPVGVLAAAQLEGPLHTLGNPRLSHQAGRGFFQGGMGSLPFTGYGLPARVGAANALLNRMAARSGSGLSETERTQAVRHACQTHPSLCLTMLAAWQVNAPGALPLKRLLAALVPPGRDFYLETIGQLTPLMSGQGRGPIPPAVAKRATQHYSAYYQHTAPFRPRYLYQVWRRCQAPQADPAACSQGMEQARRLVEYGHARADH